jgi:hypothetical protein
MNVPAAENELPTGPMNVFFYDTKTQSTDLLQCSYNKGVILTQPIQYGADNFAFLLDTNGIQNKYVVTFVRRATTTTRRCPSLLRITPALSSTINTTPLPTRWQM